MGIRVLVILVGNASRDTAADGRLSVLNEMIFALHPRWLNEPAFRVLFLAGCPFGLLGQPTVVVNEDDIVLLRVLHLLLRLGLLEACVG